MGPGCPAIRCGSTWRRHRPRASPKTGPAPDDEQLVRLVGISLPGPRQAATPQQDQLEPWADQIYQWITKDRLQMTRIHELLAMRGCQVSYPSLRRFIVNRNWRRRSKTTVRMADTPPGEVAEADFGRLGMITDPATGKRKAVWAMVIVLCHSRHCFVWPMQQHKLPDVIAGLEAAWAFFGGMPKYLVIDNFHAAVVGTDPLHPILTRGFLEYAQHRGFIPDPARKGHPQDKPKVERKVPYARERFYKGADFDDFTHVRAAAPRWCLEVAGMRIHGTTRKQPLVVFQDEERHTLIPWDAVPYEIANWRTNTVHQDFHIKCLDALYSVPSHLCRPGQKVGVRVDSKLVRIYRRGQLIKTHPRQPAGGPPTSPTIHPRSPPTPPGLPTGSSVRPPSWEPQWANSPNAFSRATIPGPRSGRDTSYCVWATVTPPSAWTPPVSGPWTSTSSTCTAWSAS